MILVTLGTQDKSFHRLLEEIESLIDKGIIQEEVIVQAGMTQFKSEKMQILDLIPVNEFHQFIQQADLVITHGGVGSIITALKNKKKVIAVARLEKYGEHTNDHQIEIVQRFNEEAYIIGLTDVSELEFTYKEISQFSPKEFKSNTNHIIEIIQDYLQTIEK